MLQFPIDLSNHNTLKNRGQSCYAPKRTASSFFEHTLSHILVRSATFQNTSILARRSKLFYSEPRVPPRTYQSRLPLRSPKTLESTAWTGSDRVLKEPKICLLYPQRPHFRCSAGPYAPLRYPQDRLAQACTSSPFGARFNQLWGLSPEDALLLQVSSKCLAQAYLLAARGFQATLPAGLKNLLLTFTTLLPSWACRTLNRCLSLFCQPVLRALSFALSFFKGQSRRLTRNSSIAALKHRSVSRFMCVKRL